MNIQKILASIEIIQTELDNIRNNLEMPLNAPHKAPVAAETPKPLNITSEVSKPPEAKREVPKTDLELDITDTSWPVAIPESSIAVSDSQKWIRASHILTKFPEISGPILDFGCGEGYPSISLKDQQHQVVGYDIKNHPIWNRISSDSLEIFTTDWEEIVERGPYKSVLLHDVIDHCQDNTPEEIMNMIYDVMEENGKIFAMVHPFSSRHGGHYYEQINKAFLHLLQTPEQLGLSDIIPNQQIIKPQSQYQKIFTDRFSIVNKSVITQNLEPWVTIKIVPLVKQKWFNNLDNDRVEKIMKISGIYYVLKKLPNPV